MHLIFNSIDQILKFANRLVHQTHTHFSVIHIWWQPVLVRQLKEQSSNVCMYGSSITRSLQSDFTEFYIRNHVSAWFALVNSNEMYYKFCLWNSDTGKRHTQTHTHMQIETQHYFDWSLIFEFVLFSYRISKRDNKERISVLNYLFQMSCLIFISIFYVFFSNRMPAWKWSKLLFKYSVRKCCWSSAKCRMCYFFLCSSKKYWIWKYLACAKGKFHFSIFSFFAHDCSSLWIQPYFFCTILSSFLRAFHI